MEREFRGCKYKINVINESGNGFGIKSVSVDGVKVQENIVAHVEAEKRQMLKQNYKKGWG